MKSAVNLIVTTNFHYFPLEVGILILNVFILGRLFTCRVTIVGHVTQPQPGLTAQTKLVLETFRRQRAEERGSWTYNLKPEKAGNKIKSQPFNQLVRSQDFPKFILFRKFYDFTNRCCHVLNMIFVKIESHF